VRIHRDTFGGGGDLEKQKGEIKMKEIKRLIISTDNYSAWGELITCEVLLSIKSDFSSQIIRRDDLAGEEEFEKILSPRQTRSEIRDVLRDKLSQLQKLKLEIREVEGLLGGINKLLRKQSHGGRK